MKNEMELSFDAYSENEGFARVAVAAFLAPIDPTLDEIADVKTAVSEAVTNSIIHGYRKKSGKVLVRCKREGRRIVLEVEDHGVGIADVQKAMEPFFTTRSKEERSGMGFAFMEAFMDGIEVISQVGSGTLVRMEKTFEEIKETAKSE